MFEEIRVLTHSSIRISGSLVLYFDPYEIREESHDADVIFITHDHFDHYSPDDIRKVVKEDTWLVLPKVMKKQGREMEAEGLCCKFADPEDALEIRGIQVRAVPAYNRLKPFHPRGKNYAGYLVTMDETAYYVAGDTDLTAENQKVKCDVALVPVGGKFTMDHKEAAKLVNIIRPRLAVPTHYGTVAGSPEDGKRFASLVDGTIETRIFW